MPLKMSLRGGNESRVYTRLDVWIRPQIKLRIDLYPERQSVLKIPKFGVMMLRALKELILDRFYNIGIQTKIITLVQFHVFEGQGYQHFEEASSYSDAIGLARPFEVVIALNHSKTLKSRKRSPQVIYRPFSATSLHRYLRNMSLWLSYVRTILDRTKVMVKNVKYDCISLDLANILKMASKDKIDLVLR
jgi:hypothetical protein